MSYKVIEVFSRKVICNTSELDIAKRAMQVACKRGKQKEFFLIDDSTGEILQVKRRKS